MGSIILYILLLAAAAAGAFFVFRFTRAGRLSGKHAETLSFLLRSLTVCLLIELFVFNFNAVHLFGGDYPRQTLDPQTAYTENYNADAGTNAEAGTTVLEFTGINIPVGTLSIYGESDTKSSVTFSVDIKDETQSNYYRCGIASLQAIRGNAKSKTVPCNFSGRVSDLRISFSTDAGETVTISSIEVNKPIGIHVSVIRLLILFFGCAAFWFLSDAGRLSAKTLEPIAIGLTCCLVLFATYITNMYRYTNPEPSILADLKSTSGNQISQEIVDAFAEGRVWLSEDVNENLMALDNPYDPSQRTDDVGYYPWDHLYYNGKYYSYYGIAPVLVLFLPYYLLTGYYFPGIWAVWLFAVLGIIFLTKFYLDFTEKFAPKGTPVSLLICGLAIMQFSSGIFFTLYNSMFYEIAQASGFLCLTAGAYFMSRSNVIGKGKIRCKSLAASTACLSMGVLCRPTLAVYCVAALLFIYAGFRKKQQEYKAAAAGAEPPKKKLPFFLPYLLWGLLPFALIGSIQMWYNWARFGNPLDFGIQYSLTINDFTHTQYHTHLALLGLYSYLIAPPEFIERFPFWRAGEARTFDPQGFYFLATGAALGMIWRALPIAAYFRAGTAYRLSKSPDKRLHAVLLAAVCAVCPLVIIFSIWESGYGTRYCVDFSWEMVLGALLICFAVYDRCKENTKRHLVKLMTGACALSLAMNYIQIYSYVNPTMLSGTDGQARALAFARLFEFWR